MNIEPDTGQDVFIIPEGAAGALAELERRKFTAEEGVGHLNSFFESHRMTNHFPIFQDHLTLLNGNV